MDKNTIIGFVLMAAVVFGFMYFNKPDEKDAQTNTQTTTEQQVVDTVKNLAQEQIAQSTEVKPDNFFVETLQVTAKDSLLMSITSIDSTKNASTQEEFFTLENGKIEIIFSNKGGRMVSSRLKDFKKFDGDSLYLFKNDNQFDLLLTNINRKVLKTSDLIFTPIFDKENNSLKMRYTLADNQYIDFDYKLSADDYMMKYDINMVGMTAFLDREKSDIFELQLNQNIRRQEKNTKTENQHSHINYKYVGLSVEELNSTENESIEVKEPTKWVAFKDQFFSTIFIADEKIEIALLESKILNPDKYLKSCAATLYIPATKDQNADKMHAGFRIFMGPLSFSQLQDYDNNVEDQSKLLELDKLAPLGWLLFRIINQYFVIPLFNLLKSTGLSMGVIILLLTIIVKLIIAPLTFKSFMSSAKMRVLKPQVDKLAEKFPKQEQAMEKQQATMALYRQAGVNPMSGCIPMLLQMPILIALFQFFPNAIDLRQQAFLWADDLSTYDAFISWNTSIPLIGNHLSLFCILMTVTNIIYTKFNMEATGGQQQMPGMKWMMYLMPLIFFFMLNDFPSGLTYYYFISLLITILLTLGFRLLVDEKKVLAKLEANKIKPKKKSGFMARLEEAQRMQQQKLKEDQKKGKKK